MDAGSSPSRSRLALSASYGAYYAIYPGVSADMSCLSFSVVIVLEAPVASAAVG